MHLDQWREAYYSIATQDNAETKRKAFARARKTLQTKGRVKVEDDLPENPASVGFSGLELTGDPVTDAASLEALLQQISDVHNTVSLSDADGSWPDEAVLTRMLTNFGVSETRASGLVKLLQQFKASGD